MDWLNKIERKIGNFYIRNLMLIIICGQILVFALSYMGKDIANILILNRNAVLNGEVWRLVTFIFVPSSYSIISFIFSVYFYYLAGTGLEHEWGEFKFNFYYFIGMLATIIVSMITGASATGTLINLSLFLAFAKVYPNFQVLLFFIIPIKVKYIAILNWVIIVYNFLLSGSVGGKILTLVPLINFFLFFGKEILTGTTTSAVNYRRQQKFRAQIKEKEVIHKCVVCGITEKEDPKMDFRYCSKCSGKKCYCENHIRNHEHK
ncbi:rhomboid family intramembrane serine protease [uncultured Clostridium sp.]|uniref:rhomboid family intramembrane serine protease n=1 Tax=uncultured Clostridium sp. TaxID=59620 RepID=UPI0025CFE33B|nr:rhomboid family intramembrane serine protease [uncultured Clostridium sp.]